MVSDVLVAITAALKGLDCAACMNVGWRSRQFLRQTPVLETEHDLERYIQAVAQCMIATFCFVALLLLASLGSLAACRVGLMRRADLEPVALMGAISLMLAGIVTVGPETRLKQIRAATPELERARCRTLQMWEAHALPPKVFTGGSIIEVFRRHADRREIGRDVPEFESPQCPKNS